VGNGQCGHPYEFASKSHAATGEFITPYNPPKFDARLETASEADSIVILFLEKKVRLLELWYTLGFPLLCNLILPAVYRIYCSFIRWLHLTHKMEIERKLATVPMFVSKSSAHLQLKLSLLHSNC
jgi:hypothetical protein